VNHADEEIMEDTMDHVMERILGTHGTGPVQGADDASAVRIVGLGGSVGRPSASLRALEIALESAAAAGATVELLDIGEIALPMYDPTAHYVPHAALRLAARTAEADGMIWSSPTYHGAMSGAFKNALDWLQLLAEEKPPYLTDRPVGLVATAAGARAMQTVNTMVSAAQGLRAWALPLCVTIGRSYDAFAADGAPRDPVVAEQLATLGRSVVTAARGFRAFSRS
jgi:FMN reductase